MIRLLLDRGVHVRAHDPVATPNARRALADLEVEYLDCPYAVGEGADALVVATAWPEYQQLDFPRLARAMRTPIFLDGRNAFPAADLRDAGFTYLGIGR